MTALEISLPNTTLHLGKIFVRLHRRVLEKKKEDCWTPVVSLK